MKNWLLSLGIIGCIVLGACSTRPDRASVKLTPTSRQSSNRPWLADPPPPATVPQQAVGSSAWTLKTAQRPVSGYAQLRETVWIVARPPNTQYDFIALHRISQEAGGDGTTNPPVFLFLPGSHFHGDIVVADERYDLRLYLANRGIDTWTLDYRTHFVPREQIYDSGFMQPWTTQAFVEDVAAAVGFVKETTGQPKIFLGGFARGATFAYLHAARHGRQDLVGLVILDGYALSPAYGGSRYRARQPTPNWFADDLESRYFPYKRWIKLLQDTLTDPNGKEMAEQTNARDILGMSLFDTRAEFVSHVLYANVLSPHIHLGTQGGLSNIKDGYAELPILARLLQHQDRYWPRVQNHGGFALNRHLADTTFDYDTALREIDIPILAFASGNSGPVWQGQVEYAARATASQDVQYTGLSQWGHLDLLWGTFAAQEVFQAVAGWLSQRSAPTLPHRASR